MSIKFEFQSDSLSQWILVWVLVVNTNKTDLSNNNTLVNIPLFSPFGSF